MKPLTILATLLALVMAPPAQARAQGPAANPQDEPWGSTKSGLQCQLLPAAPFKAGEKFRFQVTLRNVASEAVNLGDTKKAFVWFMISLGGGSDKKLIYTQKVLALADLKTNWLEGGKTLAVPAVEINELKAFDYQAGMKVQGGYITGEEPKTIGSPGRLIPPGTIKGKALLYLVRTDEPSLLLVSNLADILVQPPMLSSLQPADRLAFINQLLARFDRDAWSGQAAHKEALALGKEIVPDLLEALTKPRPAHSQMWLATAVCDIPDAKAAEGLAKLMDSPSAAITYVIAYHGPKQKSAELDKAIVAKVVAAQKAAVEPAQAAQSARMTALAIQGFLGARGAVPEEILKIGLDSPDERVRAEVVRAFAQTASPDSVRRIASLLADKNERVRMTAARVLAGMKNDSPEVLSRLVAALDLEGEQARQAVCQALVGLGRKDLPYDPKATPAQRNETIKAWKEWLAQREKK